MTPARTAVLALFVLGAGTAADAGIIGYSLVVSGNATNFPGYSPSASTNTPVIRLTNESGVAEIVGFTLTIGNTLYNFDSARLESSSPAAGIVATLTSPDSNNFGGTRSDQISYTFTGFNPAEFFQFQADLDIDNSDTGENFKQVFFGNGAAANAAITVLFSGGHSLTQTLPESPAEDQGSPDQFTFVQSAAVTAAVPEPASLALFGIGAVGLVVTKRRRRSRP